MGINSLAIRYKGTGGHTIDSILSHGVPFIKRFQLGHIFMADGNDVRRFYYSLSEDIYAAHFDDIW